MTTGIPIDIVRLIINAASVYLRGWICACKCHYTACNLRELFRKFYFRAKNMITIVYHGHNYKHTCYISCEFICMNTKIIIADGIIMKVQKSTIYLKDDNRNISFSPYTFKYRRYAEIKYITMTAYIAREIHENIMRKWIIAIKESNRSAEDKRIDYKIIKNYKTQFMKHWKLTL